MSPAKRARLPLVVPAVLSMAVLALWIFPRLWYTHQGTAPQAWFTEQTEVKGWTFEEIPISESAERVLVADRTVNGEFRNSDGAAIRVFSAKRFVENPNEIGLFVHTPDRCWVEGGWTIQPGGHLVQEVTLHGTKLQMERRLFQFGDSRELAYFCGLVDGRALPYRLDHNLSAGTRKAVQGTDVASGTLRRASDMHFWRRLWTSFASRHELSGPKQFVRISTPVHGEDLAAADARLRAFLPEWLLPGNYEEERRAAGALAANPP